MNFKTRKKVHKFDLIADYSKGKKVLDVGCVGQDHGRDESTWLHGRLRKNASSVMGVDINQAGLDLMKQEGYQVCHIDELDTNEKFDLIVMGDVIEHVNDPGAFLSFYKQFLAENGEMIICTPNVFGVRYFLQVLLYGHSGTNEEHTLGFEPKVMLELFGRIQLVPKEFYWLHEYHSGKNWKQKIVLMLSSLFIGLRSYFNANFMFIVEGK